jgi:hypothetical protein
MSVTIGDNVSLTVEIGFATSAGANKVPIGSLLSNIVWTDVSEYVRSIQTNRGRSSELDEFTTGTSNVVLSNGNRYFDPENEDGPYYGKLTPGRPIRITATYLFITKTLFFGFVDEWQQDYTYTFDSTANVSASDAFKVLNQLTLDSFFNYSTNESDPIFWLKLDEAAGSNLAFDSGKNGFNFRWVDLQGNPSLSESSSALLADSNETVAKFEGTNGLTLETDSFQITNGSPTNADLTLELVFQTDTEVDDSYGMFRIFPGERTMAVGLQVTGGVATVRVLKGSISGFFDMGVFSSTVPVNDDLPHHVVLPLRGESYPEPRLPTVDGVPMTFVATVFDLAAQASEPLPTPTAQVGLPITGLSDYNFTEAFSGSIGPIVLHPKTFTNNEIQERYQSVIGEYLAGQTTSARINTILDMASWMSDARDIGTGNSTVQAISTNGKTVLAALKECEAAEQGRLFIDPRGKVKFIPRQAINTTFVYNTSQALFSDELEDAGQIFYSQIQLAYNDRLIANRVITSKEGGSSFTADNTVSQGEYFIRTKNISNLIVESESFLDALATAQVATYSQPETRVESLVVNPRLEPDIVYPVILLNDLGNRVTVSRHPQYLDQPIVKSLILEGEAHSITVDNWLTSYSFSPVPPDYFVLNSSAFGVLDQNLLGF